MASYFYACFETAADAGAMLSGDMHKIMRRVGFSQISAAMNAWIREHFCEQIADGTVREIKQSRNVWWTGFSQRKAHSMVTRGGCGAATRKVWPSE